MEHRCIEETFEGESNMERTWNESLGLKTIFEFPRMCDSLDSLSAVEGQTQKAHIKTRKTHIDLDSKILRPKNSVRNSVKQIVAHNKPKGLTIAQAMTQLETFCSMTNEQLTMGWQLE